MRFCHVFEGVTFFVTLYYKTKQPRLQEKNEIFFGILLIFLIFYAKYDTIEGIKNASWRFGA
jgi:hypothetical protein